MQQRADMLRIDVGDIHTTQARHSEENATCRILEVITA